MWNVLCSPVFIVSMLGVLPWTQTLRGPFFERLLDASVIVFLMALTSRRPSVRRRRNDLIELTWWFLAIYILATLLTSYLRFGMDYVLVEYRQYVLISTALLFLYATGRRFSVPKVLQFGKVYACTFVAVQVLNASIGVQYRPGVFGESNYDIAAIAIIGCACLRTQKARMVYAGLLSFSMMSLSRTAMASTMLYSLLRVRRLVHVLFLALIVASAAALVMLRPSGDDTGEGMVTIDRIIMAAGYLSEASADPLFLTVGQPLANARFDVLEMSFYRDTQPVSERLQMTTPSNFHGHLWRGCALLGVPAYILFLLLTAQKVSQNFNKPERMLIYAVLLVSMVSQSIFSHPLVGTLLFAFIWFGFSKRSVVRHVDYRRTKAFKARTDYVEST